jgi:hypothetical protein
MMRPQAGASRITGVASEKKAAEDHPRSEIKVEFFALQS